MYNLVIISQIFFKKNSTTLTLKYVTHMQIIPQKKVKGRQFS